jgi:hypothetical protein
MIPAVSSISSDTHASRARYTPARPPDVRAP